MQSKRLDPNLIGKLLGIMLGYAVISGFTDISLIDPLYAGVLPQDGDARYELVFWESIKNSDRAEDYEAYLKAFPKGRFVPLAKARAAYLSKKIDSAPATPALQAPATPTPSQRPTPSRQVPATPAPQIDEIETPYKVVKTANLRAGPWTKSPIVGSLKKGEKIRATGRVAGRNWYRITTKTGLSGFVYGELIKEITSTSAATSQGSVPVKTRTPKPKESVAIKKPAPRPVTPAISSTESQLRTFKDCQECPVMVVLPAGRFVMGDARGDTTEKPAHTVSITQSFAIGKHEVTVAEWNFCILDGSCSHSPNIAGSDPVAPLRDISWTDTDQYIRWLNAKTGKTYRLPTEAEWEYAARGGTKTRFWWGNQLVKGLANCSDCGGEYDRHSPATTGSFDPNPFGLHDMNGGVWEWVFDCWHKNFNGAPKDGSAWKKEFCRVRVLRGGSWRNDSSYVHSASRFKYDADVRYLTNGFRVARSQ